MTSLERAKSHGSSPLICALAGEGEQYADFFIAHFIVETNPMNVFELTRALIDIESVTNSEKQVGAFLFDYLVALAQKTGGRVEKMEVEAERFNVLGCWGKPLVTLSTHMDTVPPFFPSRENDQRIWGRGACDAKGIIAAMVVAAEKLLASGTQNFALLFVVGEERNGAGALTAAKHPVGSRYLINGEPTENKIALGTKGALRYEIVSWGKAAHSAYPELGDSAINKLLDVLQDIRSIDLPHDELLGPSTLNIGTITGGRAPNVTADYAQAEVMIRLVGDPASTRASILQAASDRAEASEIFSIAAQRLESFPGLPETVVSFSTDIPCFANSWGKPFLIGPGSIHVAHTADEHISKQDLSNAAEIYMQMVAKLVADHT